ncbi:hypothetical protein HPP92_003488 [Vanilla planifolia]|uniref:Mitochondrial intermembrane space import and assembly protein 40 homolog n=1 Tax=Vanilla planifolia TaxID=51239 RepID=A0A835S8G3_VANPL|nr:hypothetical protein HPP92_003488 [Vanilla planifolia]
MGLSHSDVNYNDEVTNASPSKNQKMGAEWIPLLKEEDQMMQVLKALEATANGEEENESLDQKAQRALECPCVADLRKGPCGSQFSEALVCFIKSTADEKGSDCVNPFVALQNCIRAHPDAFSKDVLEEEGESDEEMDAQEYKIYPPSWAREPKR